MKTKILFIIGEDLYFRIHWSELAKRLLNENFKVAVACTCRGHQEDIRASGIEVLEFQLDRKSKNPFSEFYSIYNLYKSIKSYGPDIVQFITVKPILYGWVASLLLKKIKVVNAVTGLGYVFIGSNLKRRLLRFFVKKWYRLAINNPRAVNVYQNKDDIDYFKKNRIISRSNNHVIKSLGVNLEKFVPNEVKNEVPKVLFLSRMLKDKGIFELIKASDILRKQNVNHELWLAGQPDPSNPASLSKEDIDRWVSEKKVRYLGFSENVNELINEVDVVCLPSYREGLPMSLLEAAALKRPVVTTNVPGCREAVKDGVTGYLVEVKESEELAEKLKKLILDSELRIKMGKNGRAFIEECYSIETVFEQYFKIYNVILNRNKEINREAA